MRPSQADGRAYPKPVIEGNLMCLENQKKSKVAVVQSMNAESGEKKLMGKAGA